MRTVAAWLAEYNQILDPAEAEYDRLLDPALAASATPEACEENRAVN